MKKILRLLTAAMATCVLLIFTNCQNDDNNVTTSGSTQSDAINVKTISFEEFKKNFKAYAELTRAADRSSMSSKAIVNDTVNGFFYDDRQVKVIEYDKYKTYTFQIYRDGVVSERFENLVIFEDDAQKTSSYIFEYMLDYTEVKDLNNDIRVEGLQEKFITKSSNGSRYRYIFRGSDGNCYTYSSAFVPEGIPVVIIDGISYVQIECPTTLSVTEDGNGGSVGGGGPNVIIVVPEFDPTGPVTNPGGPGGGGGGNDPEFDPPVVTLPVIDLTYETFKFDLTEAEKFWLSRIFNKKVKDGLMNLLGNRIPFDEDREQLAHQILDFAMEGDENEEIAIDILDYLDEEGNSIESVEAALNMIYLSDVLDINAAEIWNSRDDYRNQMSEQELLIFDSLLINRRMNYLAAAKKAIDKTQELFPSTSNDPCSTYNGTGDAFRHAVWNGISSLLIGAELTEQLTTAHENRPPTYQYSSKETSMDIYNNQQGRNIAAYSNLSSVLDNIYTWHQNGNLRYLSNLSSSDCKATFSSQLIPTN